MGGREQVSPLQPASYRSPCHWFLPTSIPLLLPWQLWAWTCWPSDWGAWTVCALCHVHCVPVWVPVWVVAVAGTRQETETDLGVKHLDLGSITQAFKPQLPHQYMEIKPTPWSVVRNKWNTCPGFTRVNFTLNCFIRRAVVVITWVIWPLPTSLAFSLLYLKPTGWVSNDSSPKTVFVVRCF